MQYRGVYRLQSERICYSRIIFHEEPKLLCSILYGTIRYYSSFLTCSQGSLAQLRPSQEKFRLSRKKRCTDNIRNRGFVTVNNVAFLFCTPGPGCSKQG